MTDKDIQNTINLSLKISQNSDSTYSFQYLCLMENGVKVKLEGLSISVPTKITVQLTNVTSTSFMITECLIPCDQKTITAKIHGEDGNKKVTLIDRDNELTPKDYNFIIIAKSLKNHEQIVCDPQVHNKGKM